MQRLNREESLTSGVCLGNGEKFTGFPCENLEEPSFECRLLVGQMIRAVFEYGRCLSLEIIYNRLEKILKKFGYPDEYVDLKKFLYGSDGSDAGFLNSTLRSPNIQALYSFVNKSLYNEVSQTLRSRGLLAERRKCGSCMHRAQSSPRVCQFEHIRIGENSDGLYNRYFGVERLSSDEACSGYSRIKYVTESLDSCNNPGHPANTAHSVESVYNPEESAVWRVDYSNFREWLINRVLQADSAKRRQIAQRQYDSFVRISQLYVDHGGDAIKVFLDEISDNAKNRDSNRKRLERDLLEMKTFFTEKMSE